MRFDENFDVRSIRREGEIVKVLIDYTPPDNWLGENVQLENSFVRAHECLGPIHEDIFLSAQTDENGYYTPMVFINETDNNVIELMFPIKMMYAKCLFSYRVSGIFFFFCICLLSHLFSTGAFCLSFLWYKYCLLLFMQY